MSEEDKKERKNELLNASYSLSTPKDQVKKDIVDACLSSGYPKNICTGYPQYISWGFDTF